MRSSNCSRWMLCGCAKRSQPLCKRSQNYKRQNSANNVHLFSNRRNEMAQLWWSAADALTILVPKLNDLQGSLTVQGGPKNMLKKIIKKTKNMCFLRPPGGPRGPQRPIFACRTAPEGRGQKICWAQKSICFGHPCSFTFVIKTTNQCKQRQKSSDLSFWHAYRRGSAPWRGLESSGSRDAILEKIINKKQK